jgi:hypothetical protein
MSLMLYVMTNKMAADAFAANVVPVIDQILLRIHRSLNHADADRRPLVPSHLRGIVFQLVTERLKDSAPGPEVVAGNLTLLLRASRSEIRNRFVAKSAGQHRAARKGAR